MRKRKYDAELIIKTVKGHIEEGLSSRQLSVQYNIHHGIIEEWIVQYKHNGINAFLQEDQNRVYSIETKMQAVEDSVDQSCRILSISRAAYYKWAKGELSSRTAENERIADLIEDIHEKHPEMG